VIKSQVSRRIPILKLPVKASASHVLSDVDIPRVSEVETGVCNRTDNVRIVADDSKQSVLNSSSSVVENVCKNASIMKTDRDDVNEHKDVIKKMRLQKRAKDSSLASPVEASHLQNIATFGVECLGDKAAKVSYVGSGLMLLPSPVLSGVSGTQTLSYTLYTPSTESGQSQSGSQLLSPQCTASHLQTAGSIQALTSPVLSGVAGTPTLLYAFHTPSTESGQSQTGSHLTVMSSPQTQTSPVLSGISGTPTLSYTFHTPSTESGQSQTGSELYPQHTASHLQTAGSIQTLTAADADMCSLDSSVIDTEVVETVTGHSSLSHAHRRSRTSLTKRKSAINTGRYLLNY